MAADPPGTASSAALTPDNKSDVGRFLMLTIRNEQLAAVTAPLRSQFVESVRKRLHEVHPEECGLMDVDTLTDLVVSAGSKAAKYGLVGPEQIYRFVESALLLGDDFDESPDVPWAAELLQDELRDPAVKAAKLTERTQRAIADHMAAVDAELLQEAVEDEDDE